jgi:hypothetical protein
MFGIRTTGGVEIVDIDIPMAQGRAATSVTGQWKMVDGLNLVLGTKLKPEYFDCPYPFYQPHTEADMLATKRDLKIEPRFSLETGLKDYFESGWLTKGRPTAKAKTRK